jgi:hypothetical protein
MRRRAVSLAFLSCVLAAHGCSDDDDKNRSIVGDWFLCQDSDCNKLDNDGLRFEAIGKARGLKAPGSELSPTGKYCEMSTSTTFTFDGASVTLHMTIAGKQTSVTVPWRIDGDIATSETATIGSSSATGSSSASSGGGTTTTKTIRYKRELPRSTGTCKSKGNACTEAAQCTSGVCTNSKCT